LTTHCQSQNDRHRRNQVLEHLDPFVLVSIQKSRPILQSQRRRTNPDAAFAADSLIETSLVALTLGLGRHTHGGSLQAKMSVLMNGMRGSTYFTRKLPGGSTAQKELRIR
jgi:hypothetical protein